MDQSHLDNKYFIDKAKYNCPFCNRHSVTYSVEGTGDFDWSDNKKVYFYIVKCGGCEKESFHLSNHRFDTSHERFHKVYGKGTDGQPTYGSYDDANLDEYFFYHQPTSSFTIDSRIPASIRDMIAEADGCSSMNFMVGASGALRKAIYEFLKDQGLIGEHYGERIAALKTKHPTVPAEYFDALSNIQGMTSEELHEQEGSWVPWKKEEFDFLASTAKAALEEVYVVPEERKARLAGVLKIKKT